MEEPLQIVSVIHQFSIIKKRNLRVHFQEKALVTAGPTVEVIDPVRYVSNRSSGKMGFAIAEALRDKGADVILITGPTQLSDPSGMQVIHVQSAEDMFNAVKERYAEQDIVFKAAAVSIILLQMCFNIR